jgi:exonuclease III
MYSYRVNLRLAKAGKGDVFSEGKYNTAISNAVRYFNENVKDDISIYKFSCGKRNIVLFINTIKQMDENVWLRKLRGFTMYLLKNTDLDQYVVNTRLWTAVVGNIEYTKKIMTYNINGCGMSSSMLKTESNLGLNDSFGSYFDVTSKTWDEKKLHEVGYSVDDVKENLNNIKRVIENEDADYIVLQEYQLQYQDFLHLKGYEMFHSDRYDSNKTAANRVRLFIKSIEAREFEPLEGIIKDCYRSRNVVACINHKKKILIIGVDMPIGSKNKKEKELNEQTWSEVNATRSDYIGEGYKVIVVGYFNAHNGLKSEYRKKFEDLNEGMVDMVPSDIITFIPGRTTIDHILLSWDQEQNTNFKPYKYSDHVMITSVLKL